MWPLAKKELRLLLRDRLSAAILLLMPLSIILALGLLTGEGFGQKPDNRLRISLVDEDLGYVDPVEVRAALAWFKVTPNAGFTAIPVQAGTVGAFHEANRLDQRMAPVIDALPRLTWGPYLQVQVGVAAGMTQSAEASKARFRRPSWASRVQLDLEQTEGLRVEMINSREQAKELVDNRKRPAVFVFGPHFTERVDQCSFLVDGINPFYRDGVSLQEIDAVAIKDPTQGTSAAIMEQVVQVSLMRVILPWMIGRAFRKLGDPTFMTMLADEVPSARIIMTESFRRALGPGIQRALKNLFRNYNLTGENWADLTKSDPRQDAGNRAKEYVEEGGTGPLQRGATRYQILVPSYTVMFAFSLVLTVGWLFVSERRQGTLKRLRAAPLSRWQILLGKLLPCLALSVFQGLFLLAAGKLIFDMHWGPKDWSLGRQLAWLLPLVASTSFAAMGIALLVAAWARTEVQVAIAGTLLVLGLALISGCLVPRDLMPDSVQQLTLITPHAWALDAYAQLFLNPEPNVDMVRNSCLVLSAFGSGFVLLAWWFLKLD
jgi:ABC-type transport system involved in multi-copper enzyme maturation permease subunit